ncbi:unnamed protein product [Macrosiphum euphorbiae]|uniref:Uncharacterized protein n=1 Tax=Macrosiphum euphorbiae TaxID=13131 RepID=A0AAV0X803_9HEMI|nr:unnamed protein product [Macrosiphum euphorbiae]
MADQGQATQGSRLSRIPRLAKAIRTPIRRPPYPPARTSEVPTNAGQQTKHMLQSSNRRDEDQSLSDEDGCNLRLPDTDDEEF